jgi:flagellar protein FlgJ
MSTISPTSAVSTTPSPERAKLREAAQGFEAIFVRQMLATARQTNFGNDLFGGQADDTFNQMRDERFAEIASKAGSFGLANQLEAQLAGRVDAARATPAAPATGK